jgi:hypothetical protein
MKTDKNFKGNKGKEILEVDENILPPPTYIEIDNIITNLKWLQGLKTFPQK